MAPLTNNGLVMPFTRSLLDVLTVDGGEHDGELVLRAACHPAAGVRASYDRAVGTLALACHACDRLVAVIVVHP